MNGFLKKMVVIDRMKKSSEYTDNGISMSDNKVNGSYVNATIPNKKITEMQAKEWVKKMMHSDGSMGELFTMEQAKSWLMAKGYSNVDVVDFYAMINAMKSDYSMVAKKFNILTDDFYGELAKSFIEDKDAMPNKVSLYWQYIVKK